VLIFRASNVTCAVKYAALHLIHNALTETSDISAHYYMTYGFISNSHRVAGKGEEQKSVGFVIVVVGVTMPTAFITPGCIATQAEHYGWVAI